ncbi:MAG: PEP-CTERM sorting domain-containing protein [Fimbriimonadales bacterium]|nr:PEP-CTERM sorting domain-containing protein [Fimbriimonadales bacterium]
MIQSRRKTAITLALVALHAYAIGYNAVVLHGPGVPFPFSYGWGIGGGQQVGHSNIFLTGGSHALLWSGSPESLIDLHPAGFDNSYALAAEGGRQVGHVELENPFRARAVMWFGSPENYANLHAEMFHSTFARGIGGDQQVGFGLTQPFGNRRAMLWRGSAESAIVLSTLSSEANDTDGFQQVGAVGMGGPFHAALWTGTPESFVDLNPPGSNASWAYSVAKGQQVGYAGVNNISHAALWFGTPQSYVDLHPYPTGGSTLFGTNGIQQVGQISVVGVGSHAGVWSGTAESFVNLHQFLPPQFHGQGERSEALGIDEFGNIVGWARELGPNGGHRAVMWVVPEPATLSAIAIGLLSLACKRRRKKSHG